jgi:hypothetical protein
MDETIPSSKKTYEAYGLYDIVRIKIFNEFTDTTAILEKIVKKECTSGPIPENDSDVMQLKAKLVSSLGLLLLDKLNYPDSDERFKVLRALELYVDGRRSISAMKLQEAKIYLRAVRTLIEALGITRFEREKMDPTNLPAELIGQ